MLVFARAHLLGVCVVSFNGGCAIPSRHTNPESPHTEL